MSTTLLHVNEVRGEQQPTGSYTRSEWRVNYENLKIEIPRYFHYRRSEVPAVRLVSVSYLWLRWKNFSPGNFAATRANFKSSRNLWICYLCEKTLTKRCYQLRALSSCTTLSCLFVSSFSLLRRSFLAELPLLRCRHHLPIIREKCACGFEIRTTVRTPAY